MAYDSGPVPLPVVVIEVAPPDAHPRFPAELSAACSNAVRRGRCVIAGQAPPDQHPAAVAIVTWGGQQLAVRVQVGVRREPGTRWLMRDMHFKQADQPVERWRAVGLTIATLVGELPGQGAPVPAPARPPSPSKLPPPKTRKPRPPAPARPRRWWIEAGAMLGPGLDTGAPRGGGYAGGAYVLDDLPLLAHVSLGYAQRPADVRGLSVQFLTLQAGAGARLQLDELELDGRLGVSLQWIGASAAESGAKDSGSRVLGAWHLGADVAWPGRGFVALVAGADAWAFQSPTRITIEGVRVATVPSTGILGRLGIRFRLR